MGYNDLIKIFDDENCPCGSEKTYKECCKYRKDENINIEELLKNESRMNHEILKLLRNSRIRTCMHPNKDECSKNIIGAHSLQNNGVLSLISEKAHVIEIKQGLNRSGINLDLKLGSKNKVTTFTGFCKYHDTEVFKPIETMQYNPMSEQQNFLFAYRIYALEYYKKIVAFKSYQKNIRKMPSRMNEEVFVKWYRSYQLSMKDFDSYKDIMNNCLINNRFDRVMTYVVEFDYRISFATCFAYAPLFDLEGKNLELGHMANFNEDRLKMNFVTVIPQETKSYIIYSWLKEDDEYFKEYINQLKALKITEVKRIFNNLIPEYSENIVFAPKLWNRFSDYQKQGIINKLTSEFPNLSNGSMITNNLLINKLSFNERAPYNLFIKF